MLFIFYLLVSQGAHGRLKREIGKSSRKRVSPLRQELALQKKELFAQLNPLEKWFKIVIIFVLQENPCSFFVFHIIKMGLLCLQYALDVFCSLITIIMVVFINTIRKMVFIIQCNHQT